MTDIFLQDIIEDINLSTLPYNWNSFDLESFSKNKKLWDCQQTALKNAIKVLWKYIDGYLKMRKEERSLTTMDLK